YLAFNLVHVICEVGLSPVRLLVTSIDDVVVRSPDRLLTIDRPDKRAFSARALPAVGPFIALLPYWSTPRLWSQFLGHSEEDVRNRGGWNVVFCRLLFRRSSQARVHFSIAVVGGICDPDAAVGSDLLELDRRPLALLPPLPGKVLRQSVSCLATPDKK